MYPIGATLVYGRNGVCRVRDVGEIRTGEPGRLYYTLEPLFQKETIYIPVDTKGPLRAVLTREEAEELVRSIPEVQVEAVNLSSLPALSRYYQQAGRTSDCRELVRFIKTLRARRSRRAGGGRPGNLEERYLHQAEEQLQGELSVALGIPREDVPGYIETVIGAAAAC